MLLKTVAWIPYLNCLTYFSGAAHKATLKKASALWVLTSLPLLAAALISTIPPKGEHVAAELLTRIVASISPSELFLYAASFLTPILYLVYENKKTSAEGPFKVGIVALTALVLTILTAIAFGVIKASPDFFNQSFLNYYLKKFSLGIYFFALYCWYLTLLFDSNNGRFVDENRRSEDEFSSEFSSRLRSQMRNSQ